jgi:hypothetical protein
MNKYRLDEGLFLEDLNILIPWNTHFDQLKTLPITKIGGYRDRLQWSGHQVFDGMQLNFDARFYPDSTENFINNGFFNYTSFYPQNQISDPVKAFHHSIEEFENRFGQPTKHYLEDQEPYAEWKYDNVKLKLYVFNRFGAYLTGDIHYGADPFEKKN